MKRNKRAVGAKQEERACAYLAQNGIAVLARNYYTCFGELDIVGKEQSYYVFVEVKYRKSDRFGAPEEAVDARKMSRIRRAAQSYLLKEKGTAELPVRFDVLAMTDDAIRHYKDAF